MEIMIWRDSVAMGDDADAPHEWRLPLDPGATAGAVVEALLRARYLPSIAGGEATWIVEGARPLAVVAQQWEAPRWLVPPETPVAALRRPAGPPDLEVRYWCQADPDRVRALTGRGCRVPIYRRRGTHAAMGGAASRRRATSVGRSARARRAAASKRWWRSVEKRWAGVTGSEAGSVPVASD
jgi:hypothetical protein